MAVGAFTVPILLVLLFPVHGWALDSESEYVENLRDFCAYSLVGTEYTNDKGEKFWRHEDRCTIDTAHLFSGKSICDPASILSCIRELVVRDFDLDIGPGQASKKCGDDEVCRLGYVFFDRENNFEKKNGLCGYQLDGYAELSSSGWLSYTVWASVLDACWDG